MRTFFGLLFTAFTIVVSPATTISLTNVLTANVAVHSPGGQFAPLREGEAVFTNWTRYTWLDVPTFAQAQDFLFWQTETTGHPAILDGITTFEVLTDGLVLIAVTTRWGGGGSSSGGWTDEVTTRAELEDQGWELLSTGPSDARDGGNVPFHEFLVFGRESTAGEVFTYRTEKYRSPLVLRSVTVVPEPSAALLALLGLGGLLVRRR